MKLYDGPLGKTFSGQSEDISFEEHSKSYPTMVIPIMMKKAVTRKITSLTDKQMLHYFKEESIGAECHPKCGNCECGKCAIGSKLMSLKEEKDYEDFKNNMYLDVKGTDHDPGPYWKTKYSWTVPKVQLEDNYKAVKAVMMTTIRKLDKNPAWRKTYDDSLRDLIKMKVAREVSNEELEHWVENGNKHY